MIHSKIISVIFFSTITPLFLFCADRKTPPQDINSSSSSWLGIWGSSGHSVSPSSLALVAPRNSTSPSSSLGYLTSAISTIRENLGSAVETWKNATSDDCVCEKLGWPTHSQQAQQQLTKTRNAYAQVLTTKNEEMLENFCALIFRRTDFLHRIYFSLPNRPDRIELAKFCLEQHLPAMSPTLKMRFESFIEKTAQDAMQASGKIYVPQESITPIPTEEDDIKSTLLKLGFSIHEKEKEEAKKILEQCEQIYAIKKTLQKGSNYELSQTPEGRAQLLQGEDSITQKMIENPSSQDAFINARAIAIRKMNAAFIAKLPCSVSLLVLQHCLKHHSYLISDFQAGNYRDFIRQQQSITSKIYEEFGQTTHVADDTK